MLPLLLLQPKLHPVPTRDLAAQPNMLFHITSSCQGVHMVPGLKKEKEAKLRTVLSLTATSRGIITSFRYSKIEGA